MTLNKTGIVQLCDIAVSWCLCICKQQWMCVTWHRLCLARTWRSPTACVGTRICRLLQVVFSTVLKVINQRLVLALTHVACCRLCLARTWRSPTACVGTRACRLLQSDATDKLFCLSSTTFDSRQMNGCINFRTRIWTYKLLSFVTDVSVCQDTGKLFHWC